MRIALILAAGLLVLTGCDSSSDDTDGLDAGAATVTGLGNVSNVTAAFEVTDADDIDLTVRVPGEGGGTTLYVTIFGATEGTYPIERTLREGSAELDVISLNNDFSCEFDGGSVVLTSVTGARVVGTFSATTGCSRLPGGLTGAFHAIP